MKRTISLLIALLLMLSFAGCVKQEANDTPFPDPDWLNENTADGDNAPLSSGGELIRGKRVLSVPQNGQDYSTLYDPAFTAEWSEEGGVTIFTDKAGSIPCMQILREAATNFDAEKYFDEYFTPKAQRDYGDRLFTVGELMPFDVAGRTLQSKMYTYEENGVTIDVMRLFDIYNDYVVMYTLYVERGENNDAFTALIDAVSYFQPDADYYRNGGAPADGDNAPAPTDVSGGGGTSIQISGEYSVKKVQPLTLKTTHYDGGFFSLDLPVGWKITTFSEYTGFGFHAFDPNEPAYKIFCYCQMGFFLKSQAAKEFYQRCNYTYQYFPVLTNTTTAGFFAAYPSYIRQLEPNAALGSLLNPEAHIFPDIYNAQAIESYPGFMQEMPYSFDNSIIRANFTSASGKQCEGLLSVQVVPTLNANAGSLDTGLIQGYGFMGIAAPDGKFGEVEAVLQKCLSTFSFTQAYLDEASRVVGRQTDQIIANTKSMQAVYDSYNAAWSARQTTYDILSQKRSDATLGYERLYDPSTGEIYQADSGFYDDYGKAAGLELIGDTSERYYLEPIDYVITR